MATPAIALQRPDIIERVDRACNHLDIIMCLQGTQRENEQQLGNIIMLCVKRGVSAEWIFKGTGPHFEVERSIFSDPFWKETHLTGWSDN